MSKHFNEFFFYKYDCERLYFVLLITEGKFYEEEAKLGNSTLDFK